MCLAIPAKVIEMRDNNLALVDILGATREVSLDLTPAAQVDSYVLVHAGFAIEVVDEQFAQETLDLIREFPDLAAEEVGAGAAAGEAQGGAGAAAGEAQGGSVTPDPSLDPNISMQQMLSEISKEM